MLGVLNIHVSWVERSPSEFGSTLGFGRLLVMSLACLSPNDSAEVFYPNEIYRCAQGRGAQKVQTNYLVIFLLLRALLIRIYKRHVVD